MTDMFKDAKVGDRVTHCGMGEGTIIDTEFCSNFPIRVEFDSGFFYSFPYRGHRNSDDVLPSLFYGKVTFDYPPRPKKMVKKTIERWVNVYSPFLFGNVFTTKAEADTAANIDLGNRIDCIKLIGNYEVEE